MKNHYNGAMAKSITTQATVISLRPQGEANSSVCLFTESLGTVHATLYGGRKSRLRSLVSPWNTGTAYLSKDSRTGFLKVSDFDVKKYRLSFRESLVKFYASSLAAEIALKTRCAGNSELCWPLVDGFLDGLDLCTNDEQCRTGLVRFLWRFLELLGVQPESRNCARCGLDFLGGKKRGDNVSCSCAGAEFLANENQFVCSECMDRNGKTIFFLNIGAVRHLAATANLSPREARNYPVDAAGLSQTRELVFYLIENAVGTKLNSLEAGRGLL